MYGGSHYDTIRGGLFYEYLMTVRESDDNNVGFRASGLGDDRFTPNASETIHITRGGCLWDYEYSGMYTIWMFITKDSEFHPGVGFRASPESHSFFTFGTIY